MNNNFSLEKYLDSDKFISEFKIIWDSNEKILPKFIRNVYDIDWNEFSNKIITRDLSFYNKLVTNLLAGDVYILRNAISISDIGYIKNYCLEFKLEC
jgi:hypothetical protein